MSSLFPRPERLGQAGAALSGAALLLAGTVAIAPPAAAQPPTVAVTTLFPGGGKAPPEDPRAKLYQGNPYYIAEGKRLFGWYNCNGCHFNGGGGIGPPLITDAWRYGGRIDQIFDSIYEGRPNGMPRWGGKLSDVEIWEIAAFVNSLSTAPPGPPGGPKPVDETSTATDPDQALPAPPAEQQQPAPGNQQQPPANEPQQPSTSPSPTPGVTPPAKPSGTPSTQ
jgi:cytochrome c oxidase cbb3-type subunit 3